MRNEWLSSIGEVVLFISRSGVFEIDRSWAFAKLGSGSYKMWAKRIISSSGKLCCQLLFFAFGGVPALADYFYVGNYQTGEITRFDSNGSAFSFGHTVSPPNDLVVGPAGTLYAANSKTTSGTWTWGNLIQQFDWYGQSSVLDIAGLDNPYSLAFDPTGNLYVANAIANNILKIDPQGQASVFASTEINAAIGLAVDSQGNLYGAFGGKSQIVRWDSQGNESVFATVTGCYDLAFDNQDHLFAASRSGSGIIYRFDALGNATAFATGIADDLAFDSRGDLYALFGSGIVKFDAQGNASFFAYTGSNATGLAIGAVPEPAPMSLLLIALGCYVAVAVSARCRSYRGKRPCQVAADSTPR